MKKLLFLFLLSACTQTGVQINGSPADYVEVVNKGKYSELRGVQDILRNVSGATLMIAFKQAENINEDQDLMAISVGGEGKHTPLSRASLRLNKKGFLVGIARSLDNEPGQMVYAKEKASPGDMHVAALVVDYNSNEMHLYLDGKRLPVEGKVAFSSKKTSDTPSLSSSLGAEDDGSGFFFQGELKDPMIWSRTLGPDVIKLYGKK